MSHDDFAFEPIPGLPEHLPKGEHLLWQGRPDAMALAREALNLRWVAGYFALLALWRFGAILDEGVGAGLAMAAPFLLLGAVVCGLLWIVAFLQARATVYTITDARVVMRIGAALTLTLNLPFRQIASAGLDLRRDGTGTIALDLAEDIRLSWLVCWPHVRPWRLRKPQPALRAIPDAARVAGLLAEAAETRIATPELSRAPAALAAE
ncbi:photosynthetic complex putative assembly protein PuhB [Marinibacterium profundimaris]|uniref:YdbS-like PH domain-containing protein n=1 Tax=Marinibacterium profundimaris TaxID=1679460 RepID=A0A225NG47_9RHOB|nr:photosynthetic complex putative assembly protein PuhB [Marinibacterium profundimaris]OWU72213.1 hypothetical protein ATO3_16700 [Marinibacterium profundimaris]